MKIHLRTFGCTYNLADSDALKEKLAGKGHEFVQEKDADIILLNTCSVKDATEQKALHLIKNEKKPLVVTGCLAQTSPEKIESANNSASIVGTFSQEKISEAVEAAANGGKAKFLGNTGNARGNTLSISGLIGRIRISTGCLGACAYCQTRIARGNLESFPMKELRLLAEQTIAKGAKEIQLTSQDCACYGFDIGETLPSLVSAISSIEGDFRVRVGMGNPDHFKSFFPSFLDAVSSEKAYHFAHIPVQSGSDNVLAQMNRAYTSGDFASLVSAFRKKFPGGMIATDVIVGYPTETSADFEETISLLERTRPEVVNVSKFSSRPKTPAFKLAQLPNRAVKERSEIASELCRRMAKESHSRLIGSTLKVMALESTSKGQILCRSAGYRPVLLENAVLGEVYEAEVFDAGAGFLLAKQHH